MERSNGKKISRSERGLEYNQTLISFLAGIRQECRQSFLASIASIPFLITVLTWIRSRSVVTPEFLKPGKSAKAGGISKAARKARIMYFFVYRIVIGTIG